MAGPSRSSCGRSPATLDSRPRRRSCSGPRWPARPACPTRSVSASSPTMTMGSSGRARPTRRRWRRPRTAGFSLVRRTAGPPATTSRPRRATMRSRSPKTTAAARSISSATTPIRMSDQLVVSVVQPGQLGTLACSPMPCRYVPRPDAHGIESLAYTAVDTFGGGATATVHIQIAPVEDPLAVSGHGDVQGLEDVPTPVFASVVDPDGPAFTMRWFAGTAGAPAPCTFAEPLSASTTLTCTHEGAFPFGVIVTQGGNERVEALGIAGIANTRPSVAITAPAAGAAFAEQATVAVAAAFDDGPTAGPHTCEINWGDGTVTAGAVSVGTCAGSHVYAPGSAGTRQITVSVLDAGLARGTASVSIVITGAGPSSCVRQPGQTCAVAGVGIGRTTAARGVRVHGRHSQRAANRTDAVARRKLAIPHRRHPLAVDHRRSGGLRRYRVAQRAARLHVRGRGRRQPPASGARRNARYVSRRGP